MPAPRLTAFPPPPNAMCARHRAPDRAHERRPAYRFGRECPIAQHAMLHGGEIGDFRLIGIAATIMDGARICPKPIVAGHAIVTQGGDFPANLIATGSPTRWIKSHYKTAGDCRNADSITRTQSTIHAVSIGSRPSFAIPRMCNFPAGWPNYKG